MGLFSSKTKHYVASSAWNLAGDATQRTAFMPSVIASSVAARSNAPLAQTIQSALRSSSSMRSRQFFSWAKTKYRFGLAKGRIGNSVDFTHTNLAETLRGLLRLGADQRLRIMSARVEDPDIEYWAEQWISENQPALDYDAWTAAYDPARNMMVISTASASWNVPASSEFVWGISGAGRKLLFVSYVLQTRGSNDLWVEGPQRLFTYRMGTGNATLDALERASLHTGEFYPAIPLRLSNVSISDMGEEYLADMAKAFKKLTGGEIDTVLTQIEEHESVADMDHVMVLPSVPLNTKEQAGLAYLWEFFGALGDQDNGAAAREALQAYRKRSIQQAAMQSRWAAQNVEGKRKASASKAVPEPTQSEIGYAAPRRQEIEISMDRLAQARISIRWLLIEETVHVGNAASHTGTPKKLVQQGKFASIAMPPLKLRQDGNALQDFVPYLIGGEVSRFALFRQITSHSYRRMVIYGLEHRNYVHEGHHVLTTSSEAMADVEDSGFLIPLHGPSVAKIGAVKGAQLSQDSCYVVINSHVTKKVKWYQTGAFRIIFTIASIALAAYTGGASFGATAGLLGTNAAVGAAIGLSGMAAAVAGAAINAIAGIVLTTVITNASTELLGDKWGTIVGSIVSFVSLQAVAGSFSGGTPTASLDALMKPENLLKLTNTMTEAQAQWLGLDTARIQEQMAQIEEDHAAELAALRAQASDILGMTNIAIDPMMFGSATEQSWESSDTFLTRTLLTGSELADLSLSLIESYADLSLELPRVTTPFY